MRATFSLVIVLVLAGCVQANVEEPLGSAHGAPSGPRAEFTDETGGLSGTVTDDALLPIESVEIVLDGSTTTASDASGGFAFSRVKPGIFELSLVHPGYGPLVVEVTVAAGEVTSTRVVLVSKAQLLAYHTTFIQRGFIACAVSARLADTVSPFFSVCREAGFTGLGEDKSMLHWPQIQAQDNLTGIWVETAWRSTQSLSASLMVGLIVTDTPQDEASGIYVQGLWQGPSPLSRPVQGQRVFVPSPNNPAALRPCADEACSFLTEHSSPNRPPGPASGNGFAVVLQQYFDDYLTVFHHEPLPTSFTALPDG